jgi:hypothetical protein
MNQTPFASSSRLLRGVTFLSKKNEIQMSIAVDKHHSMRSEMDRLLKLSGEKSYADTRLLLPWGRRVAMLSRDIKTKEEELQKFRQNALKLSRSMELLHERIRDLEIVQQEEDLSNLVSSWADQKSFVKSAARKLK